MNGKVAVGTAMGLMVGLVIAFFLLKIANKDHKAKSQYDERQEMIKGYGYKYSFYTLICLEVIVTLVEMSGIEWPVESYLVHFSTILLAALVLCVHSIWNGVYWGLNNDRKRYTIIIIAAVILNLIPVVGSIASGSLSAKGFDSVPVLNIIVLVWMAIIGLAALAKRFVDAKSGEEE